MFYPGYPTLDSEAFTHLFTYLFLPQCLWRFWRANLDGNGRKTERQKAGSPFIHEYTLGTSKSGIDFLDRMFLCSKSAVSRKIFVINLTRVVSFCDGRVVSKGSLGDDDYGGKLIRWWITDPYFHQLLTSHRWVARWSPLKPNQNSSKSGVNRKLYARDTL